MQEEESDDTKLLREWRDVQIWRVNYRPAAHKRALAASYVVQVNGRDAEAFRLPSEAWARFKKLCDARGKSSPD
jgi:hypothetical protein